MKIHLECCRFFITLAFVLLVAGVDRAFAQVNLLDETRIVERRTRVRQSIQDDLQAVLRMKQPISGELLRTLSEKLRKAYVLCGYDSLPLSMRRTFLDSMVDSDEQKKLVMILREELKSANAENRVWAAELLSERLLDESSAPILKDIYDHGWLLLNGTRCPLTPMEKFKMASGTASMGKPVDMPLLEEFMLDSMKGCELDSKKGAELRTYALICVNHGQLEMRDNALDAALRDSDPMFAFFAFSNASLSNRVTLAAAAFQLNQIAAGKYRSYARQDMVSALLIRVNDRIIAFAKEQKELFSSQREQIRGSVLSIMKGDNENWSVRSAILLEYVCGPGDVEIVHRLLKASSHEIVQEAMLASLRLSVEERTTIRPDLMKILASLPSKNPFLFQRVLYRIRDDLGLKPENETDMETYQRVLDAIQKQ